MIDKKYRTQKRKLFEDSANRTPHYGIRKYAVGAASVLLSTTLWMGAGAVVQADTVESATTEQVNTADQSADSGTASTANTQALTEEAKAETQAPAASAKQAAENGVSQKAASQTENAETVTDTVSSNTETQNSSSEKQATALNSAESQASAASAASEQTNAASTENSSDLQKADNSASNVNNGAASAQAQNELASATDGQTKQANNTVTLDAKQALKSSAVAKINKKMAMVRLASATKLADQYEAKGAEYTEIYGQTIDPKNLISNFSELPAGTTASAANLEAIKTKQGRNVVPITVTYSDGSTDTANAIVWVTQQGTRALAKRVDLKFNSDTNKSEITVEANGFVSLPIWYKGTATISGSDITKGAKIYLSSISEKYRENLGGTIAMPVTDRDGDELGTLNLSGDWTNTGTAGEDKGLYLIVTSSKKYSGDVNIKFNIADGKVYNTDMNWINLRDLFLNDPPSYGIQPYDYSGTIVQKRWLHMIGHDDQEYTINRTVPTLEEAPITNSHDAGIGINATYHSGALSVPLIGYKGQTSNPNNWTTAQANLVDNLYKEIWASKGKEKPADLPEEQNYHEVFQIVTSVDSLPSNFGINLFNWTSYQIATKDEKPSNRVASLNNTVLTKDKNVFLADNLTAQEVYDRTPSGTLGISKQADGNFLVCLNFSAKDLVPNSLIYSLSHQPAVALSRDWDELLKVNEDFYLKNSVTSFVTWARSNSLIMRFDSIPDSDGTWIMTDVTPGHSANKSSNSFYAGEANANGKITAHNVAYFVDDSQNQAIVGGTHQISGGVGDTVPLNLTVPSGYILANGQSLPTSYTFAKTNSDIIIHVVPIHKSESLTDTVNRTINYKTTDGSNAPASKSNSLKFYGTKTTGDLSNLVNRAGQDGLTVNKGDAKEYSTKKEALADLNKQATEIQNALTKYEAEKAAYDAAKKVYDEDLAKWNASQNSEHTVKGISQSLSFANEKDADIDVTSGSSKPVNFIKSSAWLGSDGKGVYSYDNITKSFSDSDISYSRAEGTAQDSSGWGKTYTGVQLKVGDSVVARYTGLKNSVYIDSSGKAHKLSKVQIKYTLNSTTANDNTANLFLSSNPNITLWFGAAGDKKDGNVDLSVDLTFYDENGNPITLGKGSNAWLNMSSLNHKDAIEYFAPGTNTAMEIPGSTIVKHDDGLWYSDVNNEEHGKDWDSPSSPERYYGAAVMELEGGTFHIGKKITGSPAIYDWYALDSSLATAYKPIEPKAPDKPAVSYHEVTATTWDGPKDFADVATPAITGYTADKAVVSDKGISHDAGDIHEVVTYTPDAQKATVTFIDDTTKKTLKVENLTGVTNAKSGYTTASQISIYQGLNYLLVSDDTNGSEIVFDTADKVDQAYTVHFKHQLTQPVDEHYTHHVTVTRTIKYVMSDGTKAPASVTSTLSFTGQDTVDAVTGQVVKTDWSPAQDFANIVSPTISGYTADRSVVSNTNISHSHADINEVVTYTPDAQKATVTYIDATTGKTLKVDSLTGVTNAKSGYTTASSIDAYKNLGYGLTSDTTNGSEVVFDTVDSADQAYTVTLVHTYQTVTNTDNIKVGSAINSGSGSAVWPKGTDKASLEHSVVREIDYVVDNNKKQGPNGVNDSLDFAAKATVDKVTGEIVKTEWEGAKNFDPISSPALKGYTPDRKAVVNENISHDHANIYEIVYYTADPQKAIVNYVDATTGRQLKQDNLDGHTLEGSGYTTASQIKSYTDNGYALVSDTTNGAEIIFDDDDATQSYTVSLKHTYITVTPDKPGTPGSPINTDPNGVKYPDGTDAKSLTDTVNRSITYVMSDGSSAPSAVKDSLSYTAIKTIDRVTGQVTETVWSANQDFKDVASPSVKGYTADTKTVSNKNIAHDAADITAVVTYTPDPQKALVTFYDDTTGKSLKVETLNGVTNAKSGYTTASQISIYQGLNYLLVSDDTNGNEIVFDNDDKVDQAYTVHFKHKLLQPSDSTHVHHVTVSRTITYKMSDGSTPPATKTDTLSFTGQDTVDAVTGETVSTSWTDDQYFAGVTSPTVAGYTPDRSVVEGVSVGHDSSNITETVTYNADKQYAHVAYVDDTDSKTLKTDDLEGGSSSIATKGGSVYLSADSIKEYLGQGYKLISDSTNGAVITFDTATGVDQYYTVHLAHDSYTTDVSDDVHRTIVYVVKGGNHSAPSPVNNVLHFTGVQTYDKTNNGFLSVEWEPNKDFADVKSPEIKGYTVDTVLVSNRGISHDAADITVTVTYTADKQKAHVKYVDDTTGNTLKTDDLQGDSETTAAVNGTAYTTADSIKGYANGGYKLVSDGTKGATIFFDTNTGADQYYEVHLVHDTYTKDVADDVSRMITYVVKGGNHSAPNAASDKLHFTGVQTYDKVNNQLLATEWEPNKDFADVKSPEIKGYTVDRELVSNKDVAHDAADINVTVTYTADKQYAHVKYVDDTDSKTLKTDDLEGESDTTAVQNGVPYTTVASIDGYVKQGYKLVSDNTDGATIMLDHLTGVDQFYEVHLVHDTYKKAVADDVHRTVHYVVKGGNHAAPEDVEADLHFKGMQTWDSVTKTLLTTDWEPNKDFTDVDTPEIQGYTADRQVVSNRNIAHDAADINEVVTYTADKQAAHVRFVDDTDNKDIKTTNLSGDSDTLASQDGKMPYTTEAEINYYINRGYSKVSDDTNGMTIMLDHVTGQDQYYTVHLVHSYVTITSKKPGKPGEPINPNGDSTPVWPADTGAKDLQHDVNRTINYVVTGGAVKAPDSVKDSLHYEEAQVYDKVNGKLISDEWTPKQDFKDVTSPSIKGYTVDRETVSNKDIEHNHADIVETVTYNPDAQKAFVTYIDHTTGDTLAIKELDGVTNAKSGYTTKSSIVYYQGLGYQFISDTTDGKEIVYDNDDKVDQYYTVYLEHSYVPTSPQNPGIPGTPINENPDGAVWPKGTDADSLQHDVNRTINYVVTGGKDKAPASVHDKLHFEALALVDRVTGELVSTKWDTDKNFTDVKSPELKGYTVDRKVVSNMDIGHDHADIVETVTYNPDAQKATVTYIDKTTGKQLKLDKLDGVTHADSGYNTAGTINVYKNLGYALVSDSTGGKNIIFDNDDKADQAFTVTLEHTYITVTPKDQIKEGTPINPGKGSSTYTEGATPEALQHDVKRNIHYVVSNGKKQAPADVNDSLHYEASAVVDKVTGDVVKTTWSAPQDFKDVDSPALKGYTVGKKLVSNKNIGHDHADIKEVVTYAADPQKASVTYIDDTTGKNLDIKVLKGFTLDDSGYNTKSDIKSYQDLGYDLVSDSSNGAEIIFDDEDGIDQTFIVHLAHGKITVTEEKPGKPGEPINPGKGSAAFPDGTDKASLGKDVVRTITYKMVDGSKAPEGTSQTLHFTASKVIDKVTGQVLSTTWSGTQDFKDVASPAVAGYTPDQKVISDKGITHIHSDIDEVVTYVPDPQKALVTYYDDTTGKVLKADSLVGVTNKDSGYTTKGSIAGYINLGYKLVSDETGGKSIVFDNDDSSDQAYKVHLAHDYITVTPIDPGKPGQPINPDANGPKYPGDTDVKGLTDTVNRTITYVMSDGSKAPAAVKDTLSFTAKKTIDKATGEVVKTEWSANQDFKDVDSPSIKGYTADKKTVSNKDVAHDASDIKVVVKYTADAQKASVTYIDDAMGKSLKVDNLDGVTNAKSGYTTASQIKAYQDLGYKLVSDSTNGAEIVFDNEDSVDQAFTVHLGHGKITVTPENPGKPGQPINPGKGSANYPADTDVKGLTDTVNRTITYVMSDGSKAPAAVKDTLSYTASKVIDKVTGQVLSTTWSKNQDFKDVDSPSIKGYTADTKTVSNKDVAHDAADISVVVNYKADAQKASVTYIDDATGKSLKVDELNGVTNAKSGYTTAYGIKTYLDLGYKLVGDDTDGKEVVFDNDDKVDQTFTVHLGHDKITVTPENPGKPGTPINTGAGSANWPKDTDKEGLTSTVTRTITYKMSDGSKAPDEVRQSLYFTGEKTIDKVTGEVLETKWSANQDFDDVESPVIAGYTASLLKASDKNISHDDLNIFVSVVYKADKQKATITYMDDTTGKTIETKSLAGVSNEHSGYSTISTIKSLENRGYKLVSDDTTGSEIVFDNDDAVDQAYSVHLEHGVTTVTPESPKNPVNGSDMTDRLTKTVHQTIKYVTEDGKRLAKSNVQTLTFQRNILVDLVTGRAISYSDWSGNGETNAAPSPKVAGYKADTKAVEAHSYMAEDFDKTFTVTYKATEKAVNMPEGQAGKKEVPSPAEKPAKKAAGKAVTKAPAKVAPAAGASEPAKAEKAADKQAALPQTGESKDKATLFSLGLASILAGIGILGGQKRKKKEN